LSLIKVNKYCFDKAKLEEVMKSEEPADGPKKMFYLMCFGETASEVEEYNKIENEVFEYFNVRPRNDTAASSAISASRHKSLTSVAL
jgi:hypothetical protein